MKLKTLEIQAFGPFAGTETIAFEKLGDNPLFLIEGPTGAGKSSGLHAVCYALYGETTDADRKTVGLRCDQAVTDLLTQVTLDFEVKGIRYRITRTPTQMRPAKRGDGETEQKAEAHLRLVKDAETEETLVAKKVSDADTEIKRIVGLTASQFRQVMVLPQGKFREFLLAKTTQRQEILSTLFQTQIYKHIQEKLRLRARDINRKNDQYETRKQEALADVGVDQADELALVQSDVTLRVEAAETDKRQAQDAYQKQRDILNKAVQLQQSFQDHKQKQQRAQALEAQASEIEAVTLKIAEAELANQLLPLWQQCQQEAKDLAQLDGQLVDLGKNLLEASKQQKQATEQLEAAKQESLALDGFKANLLELDRFRVILKDFDAIQQRFEQQAAAVKEAEEKLAKAQQQLKDSEAQITDGQRQQQTLQEALNQKPDLLKRQQNAQKELEQARQVQHLKHQLSELGQQQAAQTDLVKDKQAAYSTAKREADQLELTWHQNQAAALAQELEQGSPCLVCGSCEHPSPASVAEMQLVEKSQIDAARLVQQQAQAAVQQVQTQLAVSEQKLKEKQDQLQELDQALGLLANQPLEEFERAEAALAAKLQALDQKADLLEVTNKKIQQLQEDLRQQKEDVVSLQNKQQQGIAACAAAQSDVENAEKSLPEAYRTTRALEEAYESQLQLIQALQIKLEKAEQSSQKAVTELTRLEQQQQSYTDQKTGLLKRNEVSQQEWQKQLSETKFDTAEQVEQSACAIEQLQLMRGRVQKHQEQKTALAAALEQLEKLLEGQTQPDLSLLEQSVSEAERQQKQAEAVSVEVQHRLKALQSCQTKLDQIATEQASIQEEYKLVGTLAEAANGKKGLKVELESFVLGSLLDVVLAVANQRLKVMSKGQFMLKRCDETTQKGNAKTGLDLAINDAYTGKDRPVATLSGGESFMASLALALALSEVVQQRSGGVEMKTLFVDEGFGSLDPEALQLSINTLVDLQATGRAVGVISHVSELKEQMAKRINIIPDRSGSKVRVKAA